MKTILTLLLIFSVFLLSACPKETALKRSAKASFEMATVTVEIARATEKAYLKKIISLEQKDKLVGLLKQIRVGGKRFHMGLEEAIRQLDASSQDLPKDTLAALNKLFSSDVVEPFLKMLEEMKLLSPETARSFSSAIEVLRSLIKTIQTGFQQAALEILIKERQTYA